MKALGGSHKEHACEKCSFYGFPRKLEVKHPLGDTMSKLQDVANEVESEESLRNLCADRIRFSSSTKNVFCFCSAQAVCVSLVSSASELKSNVFSDLEISRVLSSASASKISEVPMSSKLLPYANFTAALDNVLVNLTTRMLCRHWSFRYDQVSFPFGVEIGK